MLTSVNIELDSCLGRIITNPNNPDSLIGVSVINCDGVKEVNVNDPNKILSHFNVRDSKAVERFYLGTSRDSMSDILFTNCDTLSEIVGFSQVDYSGEVHVRDNKNLSKLCFLQQIYNRKGSDYVSLENNATGANSETEVLNTDCSDFNTSISELELDDIPLYPNPTSNKLFIDVKKETAYTIYSSSGILMKSGTLAVGSSIDVSALSSGLYLISMEIKWGRFIKD